MNDWWMFVFLRLMRWAPNTRPRPWKLKNGSLSTRTSTTNMRRFWRRERYHTDPSSQSRVTLWLWTWMTLCVCVCVLQKLICERDTLKETTVELRCAQVQQQCLTGHTHCIYRQKHKPRPLSHCQSISSLSPCVCRFSERCFRSRRQPGGRDHAYRAQVSTSWD